jgi:hypothetical protein
MVLRSSAPVIFFLFFFLACGGGTGTATFDVALPLLETAPPEDAMFEDCIIADADAACFLACGGGTATFETDSFLGRALSGAVFKGFIMSGVDLGAFAFDLPKKERGAFQDEDKEEDEPDVDVEVSSSAVVFFAAEVFETRSSAAFFRSWYSFNLPASSKPCLAAELLFMNIMMLLFSKTLY